MPRLVVRDLVAGDDFRDPRVIQSRSVLHNSGSRRLFRIVIYGDELDIRTAFLQLVPDQRLRCEIAFVNYDYCVDNDPRRSFDAREHERLGMALVRVRQEISVSFCLGGSEWRTYFLTGP